MSTSTQARNDFEAFVAARSDRLWRTAYLLSCDPDRAEHLLEEALARVRFRWRRLDTPPEVAVRQLLVTASLRRWRALGAGPRAGPAASPPRRRADETGAGADVWSRWRGLSPRQRAAVVLRAVAEVEPDEAADALDCGEHSVDTLLAAALTRLGPGAVPQLTAHVESLPGPGLAARLDGVERAGETQGRGRRRRAVGTGVAAVAALLGAVVAVPAPAPAPPDPSFVPDVGAIRPLTLAGLDLPQTVRRGGFEYEYVRSEETRVGGPLLRMAVAPDPAPQLLAWVAVPAGSGQVRVSVDGTTVRDAALGLVHSGLVLSQDRPHLVVVRATTPVAATHVGVALYQRRSDSGP